MLACALVSSRAEADVASALIARKVTKPKKKPKATIAASLEGGEEIRVRRVHRRDLNRVWEFLKLTFRDVNRETVEYQRPRNKQRFLEVYDEEGIEQLLFELAPKNEVVGYAECSAEVVGSDNWINLRYFEKRSMRPMFVDELAVHPRMQGRGVGSFVLEQLEHLARVRGCTHLVLEVAQNNQRALKFYRMRSFYQLDAAIFLAKKVAGEEELLPPRKLKRPRVGEAPPTPKKTRRAPSKTAKRRAELEPAPRAPAPPPTTTE
jgi:ribosomal protein S18 acetylase RimI-like enzyme